MRSDMRKVLTTPPRTGGGYGEGRNDREANRDPEDLPTKESMKKKLKVMIYYCINL